MTGCHWVLIIIILKIQRLSASIFLNSSISCRFGFWLYNKALNNFLW